MNNILITKEVAQMLRVSEDYVRGLIRNRKIKAYKEGRRGGFRIPVDEVNKYIEWKQKEFERSENKDNKGIMK